MVSSISRQSVIIKCNMQSSVLLGNYEMYYLAGLLKKLYDLPLSGDMKPEEMMEAIHANEDKLKPQNKQEEYMVKIVKPYLPLENYDEQMKELFDWGASEKDLWKVNTSHKAYE